jgi:hypothetical protein
MVAGGIAVWVADGVAFGFAVGSHSAFALGFAMVLLWVAPEGGVGHAMRRYWASEQGC